MILIPSSNYSYRVVGRRIAIFPGETVKPFWAEDGTIDFRWEGRVHPQWASPAERAAHRATLRAQILPPPPYPITEDTIFGVAGERGPNFEQELPHTEVFTVAPGVRAVFEKGNFTNCTIPDEVADADIGRIQNIQGVYTPTANPRLPVRLLAEDEATATFSAALKEVVGAQMFNRPVEEGGCGGRLGLVKPLARERRKDQARVDADLAVLIAENEAKVAEREALPHEDAVPSSGGG